MDGTASFNSLRPEFACSRPLLLSLVVSTLAACASTPVSANVDAVRAGLVRSNDQKDLYPRGVSALLEGPPLDDLAIAGLTIRLSPALRAVRAQAGVADALTFAAGLLPDPQLQLSFDHPTDAASVDAVGASAGLDLLTALFGHASQVARARAESSRVRSEITWTEWTMAAQARDAALRSIFLRQQIKVAQDAADQAKGQLLTFESAVTAGDAKLDDLALRRVAYLDTIDRLRGLEQDLAAASSELQKHLGLAPDQPIPLVEMLAPIEPGDLDLSALFARAVNARGDLAALRAGYDANEAGLSHARLASLPLPNLTLSFARDTSDIRTTGVGVSLVLPIWNRGRGDIAIGSATRTQLQAEYAARLIQTRADIAAEIDVLKRIVTQRAELDSEIDALARESETLAAAAARGDVPSIVYETTRASLLDKRLRSIALGAAEAQGEAALEGLVGGLIWQRGASQ